MTEGQHARLMRHFWGRRGGPLAFMFAGVSESPHHLDLVVRDVCPIERSELVGGGTRGVELADATRRRIFSLAAQANHAVIEAHAHGSSGGGVTFSSIDAREEANFVPYVRAKLPGLPYGATVWGEDAVDAHFWFSKSRRPVPIDCVRVVGAGIREFVPTSSMKEAHQPCGHSRYHRQILALGAEGQSCLKAASVAIVGLGGLGSHVAQQLAYLGVGELILVDHDVVETSNLNRLIGATPGDVRRPKVKVAERLIKAISPDARVRAFRENLASTTPLETLRTVSLLVGCTDTEGSRLILNELAKAYLLPYIDCGVGITVDDGIITSIGGRVMTILPDGPCLLCAQEIDRGTALQDLETEAQHAARRRAGYVTGAVVPEPSVVALDGVVASLAVNEAIALLTGWRAPMPGQVYYGDGRATPCVRRLTCQDPRCVVCATGLGTGDASRIERYARKTLPKDLPR